MKTCPKCKETKKLPDGFHRNKGTASGFNSYCKMCMKPLARAWGSRNKERSAASALRAYYRNRDKPKTDHVLKGYAERIKRFKERHKDYGRYKYLRDRHKPQYWFNSAILGMRQRSKRRSHPLPELNSTPSLQIWAKLNGFQKLWEEYESSGFDKRLRPSIDRIDNSLPYITSNLMLVTWAVNLERAAQATRERKLRRQM